MLQAADMKISMDGRSRWMNNVFIERLWRSLKYECVCLNDFETGSELRKGVDRWFDYYNNYRPHSTLAGRTPPEPRDVCANRPGFMSGYRAVPKRLGKGREDRTCPYRLRVARD